MGFGAKLVGGSIGYFMIGPVLTRRADAKRVPCSYCDHRNGCMMTQCPNYPQLYAATIARQLPPSPSNPAPPSPIFRRRRCPT